MTLAIMQPYLFPYTGYWQLINAVDTFVIFDDVNFIKKGYINRNSILLNGKPHIFTLELIGASQNKLINEIEIGGNSRKILKTIEMSYKKSPYFYMVFPIIKEILDNKEKKEIKRLLKIYTHITENDIHDFLDMGYDLFELDDVIKNELDYEGYDY